MNKTIINIVILAIALLLVQAVVFNNITLLGIATPFAYIYIIIHLSITLSQNWALTIAFLLGLVVDVFADTLGFNALACTIITAMRHNILRLYLPREEELADPYPSSKALGVSIFAKYSLTMSLLFCTIIFLIDSLSFFSPLRVILRIVCSTIFSWVIIMAIDSLFRRRNEKRL